SCARSRHAARSSSTFVGTSALNVSNSRSSVSASGSASATLIRPDWSSTCITPTSSVRGTSHPPRSSGRAVSPAVTVAGLRYALTFVRRSASTTVRPTAVSSTTMGRARQWQLGEQVHYTREHVGVWCAGSEPLQVAHRVTHPRHVAMVLGRLGALDHGQRRVLPGPTEEHTAL